MSYKRARGVLGVSVLADDAQVRRAYHACAKRAHPDRPGGDAEAFRQITQAYEKLRPKPGASPIFQPPPPCARSPASWSSPRPSP